MSDTVPQPVIDKTGIAKAAVQHEVRTKPGQDEMVLARNNSQTAHELAAGVQEYKGEKITAAQKESFENTVPHLQKMANTHAIKVAGRIEDMEKAEANAEKAEALAAGVQEYKGEKITAAQKESFENTVPHLQKMAVTKSIVRAGRIEDMEKAEANAEKAEALAAGVQEYKGEKVQAAQKIHKEEVHKAIAKAE